jgi:hypothetical protein
LRKVEAILLFVPSDLRRAYVGLAGAEALGLAGLASVLLAAAAPVDESDGVVAGSPLDAFGDEYKSEYQPPPLRIKCVPPLIRRWASDFMHLGHRTEGGSEMR